MKTFLLLAALTGGVLDSGAATFAVTSTVDTGAGSFRQAILDANANAGPDSIAFAISGTGPHSIAPVTALPVITDPVVIDGYTQPGASLNTLTNGDNAVLKIELNGANAGSGVNGLTIEASHCRVRGLVINRFAVHGILLRSNVNSVIEGNFLGTDVTGTIARGNGISGVFAFDTRGVLIGGASVPARNVVSGNSYGVWFYQFNASFELGYPSNAARIQGNYIGTDITGAAALGNTNGGVYLVNTTTNLVGGTTAGAGNLISGNGGYGVVIVGGPGFDAPGNRVQGNLIGTDVSGASGLGNQAYGVFVSESDHNFVGGTEPGAANTIAHNLAGGVLVGHSTIPDAQPTVGNAILGNAIFANGSSEAPGIDLGRAGLQGSAGPAPTLNDPGDPDTGPNNLQNFPLLTSVSTANSTTIQGTLNSTPNSLFRLEFFGNDVPDASGFGEGRQFLGFTNALTDGSGNVSFSLTLGQTLGSGQFVTATATDSEGSTSEFSPAVRMNVPSITALSATSGAVGATITITGAHFDPVATNNVVYFGAVRAMVTGGTANALTVTVPAGATFAPVSATTPGGLTARSSMPFVVKFTSVGLQSTDAFAPRVDLEDVSGPYTVVPADFDGDGKPDLLALTVDRLFIGRNVSTGAVLTTNSFGITAQPFDSLRLSNASPTFALADLDGDGRLDVAIAQNATNQVLVARNLSTPGLIGIGGEVTFNVGELPHGVALGDLDGDGRPDIATANTGSDTVSVLRNVSVPGIIAFAPAVHFATGHQPQRLAIGDLDGDGKADVVAANEGGDSVSILRNTSTPGAITAESFADRTDLNTGAGSRPADVVLGDLDGDGRFEMIVANRYFSPGPGVVAIFPNRSAPRTLVFAPRVELATGLNPSAIALGDLDGDGRPDLAVVNNNSAGISLLKNNCSAGLITSAAFLPKLDYSTGTDVTGVAIGDLNGDGRPEVIVANPSANTDNLSVFRNGVPYGPLYVGAQGGGGVFRSPDKLFYDLGESVTLTATNRRYHEFVGWSDGVTDASRMVVVGAGVPLFAIFTNTVPLEEVVIKEWDRSFGGNEADYLRKAVTTADGGYLLGGGSSTYLTNGNKMVTNFSSYSDLYVVRLDANGDKLWERVYGGLQGEDLYDLQRTGDGGFILVGETASGVGGSKTTPSIGGVDFWVVRIDANGNQLWDRTFGTSESDYPLGVQATADGGFVVGGETSGTNGSRTSLKLGHRDMWLVRLDAAGNKLWDRTYGTSGDDFLQELSLTADGGFVFAGSSTAPSGGGQYDYLVFRTDSSGNSIWGRVYGDQGPGGGNATAVRQTAEGGFIVGGFSESAAIPGRKDSPNYGATDYWVIRTDGDGTRLWDRSFGGTHFDHLTTAVPTSDGGFILGGYSRSSADGNKATPNISATNSSDAWLVRLDAAGDKVWETALGGEGDDGVVNVEPTLDGGLFVAGTSTSAPGGNKSSPHFGKGDFWAVKLAWHEGPVGTPAILVNGRLAAGDTLTVRGVATIELRTTFFGGAILYTLDGSDPSLAPRVYTGTFAVSNSVTIRAFAYNAAGLFSAESGPLVLTVQMPPLLLDSPANQRVAAGGSVIFSARALGSPPLAFQWLTNGVPLPGAIGAPLILGNVLPAQAGAYQVVVSNAFGVVTSAVAILTVLTPPALVAGPVSASVGRGSNITFTVSASGTAPLLFQWRHNGVTLAGATNASLTINNAQIADGGTYTVVVLNEAGSILAGPAVLTLLEVLPVQANDFFTNRVALAGLTNAVTSTNLGTSAEPGEPSHHPDQPPRRSVWYSWTAPATGLARFRTSGSTFDTLLAMYVGTNVSNLTAVAQDEDQGGFLASALQFNATNGTAYAIAIDGFAGASGSFVLSWELEPTTNTFATILAPPLSQTVRAGGTATFSVSATGTALGYQWLFNEVEIAGENSSTLTIGNVQAAQVGFYSVRVFNGARVLLLPPVTLEIGPMPTVHSLDKIEDLFAPPPPGGGGRFRLSSGASPGAAFTPPVLGQMAAHIFVGSANNSSVTNCGGSAIRLGESFPILGTRWLPSFPLTVPGVLTASVTNNDGTRLISVWHAPSIAGPWCHLGSSNGVFRIENSTRTQYLLAIHSTNDVTSGTRLDWVFARAPDLFTNGWRTNIQMSAGGALTQTVAAANSYHESLTNAADRIPPPTYQWFRKEGAFQARPGQTQSNFTLAAVQTAHAAEYQVVVSNLVGTKATNFTLVVGTPPVVDVLPLEAYVRTGGALRLTATATRGAIVGPTATVLAEPRLQWYFNQTAQAGQSGSAFTRTNVQLSDAGTYSLMASNPFGPATMSASVVVGSPPILTTVSLPQLASLGGAAQWSVTATNGPYAPLSARPPIFHQWHRNLQNIAGATNSSFSLTNVRSADEGSYAVAVSNYFGAVTSVSAVLKVHDFVLRPVPAGIGQFCLEWQLASGRTNLVQFKDALDGTSWQTVETGFTTNGLTVLLKTPMTTNHQRFYRILVLP